ncbi:MAG: HPr family phosphocarrier protein [Oscillospiraceae bacterium]|nr:HPr family phosphocarrier protein [Oscillospiraceae bacterium]MBQ9958902.1 HPr family phosphocarrier protein [Oscillospiraceae bacterium]
MYSKKTVVVNATGLHARPASDFVREAKKWTSRITIANLSTPEEDPANAKSIISVLSLGMGKGTEVEVVAKGDDEEAAVEALVALIDGGFGEL